jgi:hypothetical protein
MNSKQNVKSEEQFILGNFSGNTEIRLNAFSTYKKHTPNFFTEYLTQNVIFQIKSHVTKHVF